MLDPRPTQRIRKNFRFKGVRLLIAVLALAISLQVLIAVGQNLMGKQAIAQWGIIEHSVTADCLILRHELLLTSPIAGRVELAVSAGSRVRKGQLLMEIIDPNHEDQLTPGKREALVRYGRRLAELDLVILGIQRELRIYRSGSGTAKQKMDPAEIDRLEIEQTHLRQLKQELVDSESSKELRELSRYDQCIFAEQTGLFWPALDGGEKLQPGDDYIPQPMDFQGNYQNSSPVLNQNVRSGEPIGKIVEGWEESIIAWVKPTDLAFRPYEEQRCRLILSEDRLVDLEFLQRQPAPQGEFWSFREDSLTPDLLKKRVMRGTIVTRRTFGIRIPRNAMRKTATGWFASVAYRNETRSLPVRLVDIDDSWAIVAGLEPGTIVLYH